MFNETTFEQEAEEVFWDLLAVQRIVTDGFQKVASYLLRGIRQPKVSSSQGVTEQEAERPSAVFHSDEVRFSFYVLFETYRALFLVSARFSRGGFTKRGRSRSKFRRSKHWW